jgi:hypothetical protein
MDPDWKDIKLAMLDHGIQQGHQQGPLQVSDPHQIGESLQNRPVVGSPLGHHGEEIGSNISYTLTTYPLI